MARDGVHVRQSAERLGILMNSASQFDDPTEILKQHLQEFERQGLPVDKLINYGLQRYNGRTPVHLAAANGLWECLELMLRSGGDPNAVSSPTDLRQTPLHLAATKGYPRCLQTLLEHGADMNVENANRVTALDLVRGKKLCEKVFQHAIAKVQIPSRTREQQQRVETLHQIVEDGENLVHFYSTYEELPPDHMDLATRWTDWFQQTLMYRACSVECLDVVQFMLSKSPNQPLHNFNSEDTPMHIVCKRSNLEIARLLLNHSPRLIFLPDCNHLSPLHIASSRGDVEMVRLLLDTYRRLLQSQEYLDEDEQLSLDPRDDLGRTPFFNACYYGYKDIVKLFLDFQAEMKMKVVLDVNVTLRDTERTPLHAAVRRNSLEIVRMLLKIKDIEIDPEARPSARTHKKVLHILHMKHGRVIPGQDSVDDSSVSPDSGIRSSRSSNPSGPSSPLYGTSTPTSWHSHHSSSPGSLSAALDEGLGRFNPKSTDHSDSRTPDHHHTPWQSRTTAETHTRGMRFAQTLGSPPSSTSEYAFSFPKVRSTTDIGDTVGVFEHLGKFEVRALHQQSTAYTKFDHLFLTPLAEACANGQLEMMKLLLKNGAQDESGIACRIAHFLQKPELMQLILAYHCVIGERKGERKKPLQVRAPRGVHVNWSTKQLPSVRGEWFGEKVVFHPLMRDEDGRQAIHSAPGQRKMSVYLEVDFTEIRVVHLEKNNLESVPLELFCLPQVAEIDLSHNQLSRLPEKEPSGLQVFSVNDINGWNCMQLESLSLNHNLIVQLPSGLWSLPSIRVLDVSHNKLESILPAKGRDVPEDFLSETLESVDLSHNQLKVLPRFLFNLSALRSVHLQYNALEALPETLWSCVTLQELIVCNNQLTSLPWCEPEATMLESRAEAGHPTIFRESDRALTGKVQVQPKFERNASYFQRQISSQPALLNIRPIGHQELGWTDFTTVTTEGCDYSSLTKLNIAHNKLTWYPEALPCLAPNLIELDISDNTFKDVDIQFIPQSIKKLTAKKCKIERFGNIMDSELHQQVVRNCRHGRTFGLPCQHRSHTRLPCLTTLYLCGNKLRYFQLIHHDPIQQPDEDPGELEDTYIPRVSILHLLYPTLEGLSLASNDLRKKFNPNIGYQTHLKWIWLSKNPELRAIPMEFAFLKNTRQFTELSIDDLPSLIDPPLEYRKVTLSHLLTYMRSRLKESVYYRTIKLFFIGRGERGKTTLLRRLRGMPDEKVDRTTGIDIEDWVYPEHKRFSFKAQKDPVHFLAWDFAGQDVYHTTHQCFYSRRSLYLALFRLTDGVDGVNELEPWLRNVQLRAPGSPVIIVGTHLDMVSELRSEELQAMAREKYGDTAIYPRVIEVMSVSSTRRASLLFSNHMESLRQLLYSVACHLQLSADGSSLEYKPDIAENDPKALFMQQIPKSFLDLQDAIRQTIALCHQQGLPPIMEEEQFRLHFKKQDVFDDDDELNEAVFYLHLQGTLLHFDDFGLKNVYFLDPQWLAKLMANVIHPSAGEAGSPITDGIGEICQLFTHQNIPDGLKQKYIQLLEKFEVALKINSHHIIVPSLMPASVGYPKPNDLLTDVSLSLGSNLDPYYQPPLRRFWLSDYIPDGFWPRLICRIATDQQIGNLLRMVIGESAVTSGTGNGVPAGASGRGRQKDTLNWIPWKTGIVFAHRGRTLLVVKQETNETPSDGMRAFWQLKWLDGNYRIEVHVYTPEWVTLADELLQCEQISFSLDNPSSLPGLATRLMVMISQHIKSLACHWFPGMLITPAGQLQTFIPCWKGYAEIGTEKAGVHPALPGAYIAKNENPVHCFVLEDSIVPAAQGRDLECPLHGKIRVLHAASDLIFLDLNQSSVSGETKCALRICEYEVLGKGGFGFVVKGELTVERSQVKKVAVKVFLSEIEGFIERSTIGELLELSQQPKHLLYAYREIRQEVAVLSVLEHPNLTELCGVRTSPYMCLLLELAPKKSLREILKDYRECNEVLEPLTLKSTTMQIAAGLEYLHRHQIVHLDMKSPNVLAWHFPSPHASRQQRVRQAGNVWLKIADYGISQVSTGLTIRVGNNPVGTPGFMAPELFEHPGQEVSAEKVDVFAFGMTMYELLGLRSPFDHINPAIKRNHEVKDKNRPLLKPKETRSLVLLQDLMTFCWKHEPEDRPSMSQAKEWASAPEFERLRAEIALTEVKSISCACICRITPENEEKSAECTRLNGPIPENSEVFYDASDYSFTLMDDVCFDDVSRQSFCVDNDILPSVAEDNTHVQQQNGQDAVDNGPESIYQFLPFRGAQDVLVEEEEEEAHDDGGGEEMQQQLLLEPYTQIWLCGRDQRKGLLQIFTYYDGQAGSYNFSGYCSKDEVSSICSVYNTIWMGTISGTLKVFHAPTLKAKFAGRLACAGQEASAVLHILHVEETHSVLVATVGGDIWSLYDQLVPGGLKIQDRIILAELSPSYHLAKVVIEGSVEVWGTMDNNRVLVLEEARMESGWRKLELESDPGDIKLKLSSFIAHASFVGRDGAFQNHVWISYRHRSVLLCWDAKSRKQRCILNCAKKLRTADDVTFQVSALAASGKKLFVGTTSGLVGVFDSEGADLVTSFQWHRGKVRTLLVMPRKMEPCICAEMPASTDGEEESTVVTRVHRPRAPPLNPQRRPSSFSYMDNRMFIPNPEPNAVMVTSIGNGRKKLLVNEPTKAERLQEFNAVATGKTARKDGGGTPSSIAGEDIRLLTWRS